MNPLPQAKQASTSGVWPPPATGVPTIHLRPAFISLRNLVLPITCLIGLAILFELVQTVINLSHQTGLIEVISTIVAVVNSLCGLVLAIVYLMWIYRAYSNLSAFLTIGQSYTPGWAVGWYFIPIFNLFRPYTIMVEMWKASDPKADSTQPDCWRSSPSPGIVKTWWMFCILGDFDSLLFIPAFLPAFMHGINGGVIPSYSAPTLYMDIVTIFCSLIEIVGLILMYQVVRGLTDLQERKERATIAAESGVGG